MKNGCTNSSNELKNCQTGANNSFCQEPGQYYVEKDETKRSNSGCFPSNEQQNIESSKNQARAKIYIHLKDQGNIGNGVIIYIGRHISSKEPYRPTLEHVCFTSEFAEPYRIKETLFVQGAYVDWRLPHWCVLSMRSKTESPWAHPWPCTVTANPLKKTQRET